MREIDLIRKEINGITVNFLFLPGRVAYFFDRDGKRMSSLVTYEDNDMRPQIFFDLEKNAERTIAAL